MNCKVKDCNGIILVKSKQLCARHYHQQWTHGKILKRTIFDGNEFIIKDDICYIQMFDKHNNPKAIAIVDAIDHELVSKFIWRMHPRGYIMTGKKNVILLHRLINHTPLGSETDHKNENKLDNRRKNLRTCTPTQNQCNVTNSRNTSGFRGVYLFHNGKYVAQIRINGKQTNLGYFTDKIEAAKVYNLAAKKYHGEFAKLNRISI